MTFNLENAQVYDCEVFPNCFLLTAEQLFGGQVSTWEISQYRDDRQYLFQYLYWLRDTQSPMVGFNNVGYDYRMVHYLLQNPNATYDDLYQLNNTIIASKDRFGGMIWDRDRFIPQIDLMLVHHFDNQAKRCSLKQLEVAMRSSNVMESRIPFGTVLTPEQINNDIIPYNKWDVGETKRFATYSVGALEFRTGLINTLGIAVLNYNDTKIGEKMLEQRIGEDICYSRDANGRKQKRQTIRRQIALREIIFPYIQFTNPEFQRIHQFKLAQVLKPEDLENPESEIKTKGAYKIHANVGGLTFHFGTGGVHASVDRQIFYSTADEVIRDIDVEGLYPNVAIANGLAPEHLGAAYITEYAKIPQERKLHAKGTYENASLKLAANGAWGKSNSKYSVFLDAKYAMTIPINGQLMICMLVERLIEVPTLQLIQANTDGVTYRVNRRYLDQCKAIEQQWQDLTKLKLEDAEYTHMWIRDVNNYIARDIKGKLKQKGAYWHPDPMDYANSISNASPPCWYKDLGNIVSIRAAVAAMVYGIDPSIFIRAHTDPFDFMLRIKVDKSSKVEWGGEPAQSVTRYYVSTNGRELRKISPPPPEARMGAFKKKNGVSYADYNRVMMNNGWQWDESVCTGNKSQYELRSSVIEAGWNVTVCNDVQDFDFSSIDYNYYIQEAQKLILT